MDMQQALPVYVLLGSVPSLDWVARGGTSLAEFGIKKGGRQFADVTRVDNGARRKAVAPEKSELANAKRPLGMNLPL